MLRISPGFVVSLGLSGSQRAGATGSASRSPKVAISGPRTKYDITAPAIIKDAIRGPIRKPTPINSGDNSPLTCPPFKPVFAPVAASSA